MKYSALILLLILLIYHISCKNKSENEKPITRETPIIENKMLKSITDSNVYDDIDLFKMEGIRKIEKPETYPYIKIEVLNDSVRRIVYKRAYNDSIARFYHKEKNYWKTVYDFELPDTGSIRTYEYITNSSIIELNYFGTYNKTGFHLDDASMFENNKKVSYIFWDNRGGGIGPFLSPDIRNIELIKNDVNVITTQKFERKNKYLKVYSNSFDKNSKELFDIDTSCYEIGNHSWFWWQYFASFNPERWCK